MTGILRYPRMRRALGVASLVLFLLLVLPTAGLVYRLYFDKNDLPDIESFIRFELPTTGYVYDARGEVLITLAREYRERVSYDEIPPILRKAILAAEDKNFFSHSGVDYRVLPRVALKTVTRSLATAWKDKEGVRLRLPQGGSTLTQQLVRGYFLQERTSGEDSGTLFRSYPDSSRGRGHSSDEQTPSEARGGRLALWLEGRCNGVRIPGAGETRDLRPLRQLPLPGERPLWLRCRLRVLFRQALVDLHTGRRRRSGAPRGDRQVARHLRSGRG